MNVLGTDNESHTPDIGHEEGNVTPRSVLTVLASTGVLGLLIAAGLDISNNARIALNVAEQHGQELLMIRGEIANLRAEMLDQEQFAKYLESRLTQLEKQLDRCCSQK
jgi:septal ring factor EnvC (AmiA/AmiB activator)